jgi:hypothetical protein
MKRLKSRKKALSGAVTALILVIASVIIALVVVGFAFGLIPAFSSSPQLHIVDAYISGGTLYIIVSNTGSANGVIINVQLQAGGNVYTAPTTVTISGGSTSTISISTTAFSGLSSPLQPGEQVTIELITTTGSPVTGVATVLS